MRSLVLIAFLISTHSSIVVSKLRHERSRGKRQEGWEPSTWVWAEDEGGGGAGGGDWGPWTEPSPCSRPCGGGVAHQNRTCWSGSCWGSARRYFSCNIQDCPDGRDFRAEQCNEYNNIPYEEVYYDWIPYTKAPNKCALNCMPRGERFYYRHQDKVTDGTRCDEETLDVCVDGICRHVGCDKLLGSSKQEDKCRVCGGDGSTCETKQDTITSNDFKVGYNDLIMVPAGATNIRVKEVKPSNNYLAVRNASNHYYLNGNWRIDYPRVLKFAGTIFHYGRKPHGFYAPESISALGPTTEILFIVLLYQEHNPGVEYEYSFPTGSVHVTDPEGYTWFADEFSECSATCGGGYQSRRVYCARVKDSEEVSTDLCDANWEPSSNQQCGRETCPPEWHPSEWAPCSVTCGNGTQGRQVSCIQRHAGGDVTTLSDSVCLESIGEKPPMLQECGIKGPCPSFHLGPWKPCDKLCGNGTQTRTIQCFRKVDGRIELLPESSCGSETPETEKPCNLRPCEGVDWVVGEWSGCSDKCGLAFETREIMCATQEGKVYSDEYCHEYRKPEATRNCTITTCASQWYASQWSPCSSACGPGAQTRSVFCGVFENDTLTKVDSSKCDESQKYSDQQPCQGEGECKGEWFAGPYGQCSKPCGGGVQSRKLVCIKDNQTVSSKECSDESDFFKLTPCNTHSCEEDDLITMGVTLVDTSTEMAVTEGLGEGEEFCDEDYSDEETSEEVDKEIESVEAIDIRVGDSKPAKIEEEEGSGDDMSTAFTEESSPSSTGMTMDGSTDITATTDITSSDVSSSDVTTSDVTSSDVTFSSDVTSSDVTVTESSKSDVTSTSDGDSSSVTQVSSDSSDTSATSKADDVSSTDSSILTESTVDTSAVSGLSVDSTSATKDISDIMMSDSTDDGSSVGTDSSAATTASASLDLSSTSEAPSSDSSLGSSIITTSSDSSWASSVMTTLMSMITSEGPTDLTSVDVSTEGSSIGPSTKGFESSESSSTGSSVSSSDSTIDASSSSPDSTSSDAVTSSDISSTDVSGASTVSGTTSSDVTDSTITEVTSTDVSSETAMTDESGATSDVTESSIASSTFSSDETSETEETSESSTTSWSEAIFSVSTSGSTTAPKKCKKRERKCTKSEFGCCPDNKTPAKGPFNKECPSPETCKETKYDCCPDGVSPAKGHKNKGCPPSQCELTLFGCCPNKVDPALGNDGEGCPEVTTVIMDCKSSEFGCCPDGILSALGPNNQGCDVEGTTQMFGVTMPEEDCSTTSHGCCPDGVTAASGPDNEGCDKEVLPCHQTRHGCCPDGKNTATGPKYEGCDLSCPGGTYGCCDDNITLAHGPNKEGCCLNSTFGCCQDNITPALGPQYYGCRCDSSPYGCCPDGSTSAKGPENEGCGCQYTSNGCCPDKVTPASGPDMEGCQCWTYQFGCCPDGVSHAVGPRSQGCGCENSKFGCCPDRKTPAPNPEEGNCTCDATTYGCCLDGESPAEGEKFEGCTEKSKKPGDVCSLDKDRGPCREFSVKWYYDTKYGGCSRFWYGSCEGNGNRFNTQEECKAVCVEPKGRDACSLPKIEGPCKGYYPRWFYDPERKHCSQFIYGGCLGNNNRFEKREECDSLCVTPDTLDACDQEIEPGPCRGSFERWHYDKESHSCQQFTFGGCQGNKNNFLSEAACAAKCLAPSKMRAECQHSKDEGNCTESLPRWYFDKDENRCMPFYYTACGGNENNFEYLQHCEEYCPSVGKPDTCVLPAMEGDCHNFTIRFYFDSMDQRCKQFYYGGCGGNDNNFVSEADCLRRCDRDRAPPETFEEPFSPAMCFLPVEPGSCDSDIGSFYYDRQDGSCKYFVYTGCSGNRNRFSSIEECENHCSNVQDVCRLPMLEGPCDENIESWYYDARSDLCREFVYGGCQGNGNRFSSRDECENRCQSRPEPVQPATPPAPYMPEICWSPVDPGPCLQEKTSWYHDSHSGRCLQFKYGGCEGNANRFSSEEQCERQCGLFRKHDTCSEPKDPGSCDEKLLKYYFDGTTCREFMYSGCGGNTNRYSTRDECLSICVDKKEPPITPGDNTILANEAICRLRPEPGNCNGYLKRYHFDEDRGTCLSFIYTGCSANLNNFESFRDCMDICAPDSPQDNELEEQEDCLDAERECSELAGCSWGVARSPDSRGCSRCSCHDPCAGYDCGSDSQCSVSSVTNSETLQQEYVPVCSPLSKPGTCPEINDGPCDEECTSDYQCSGNAKCCYNGCGTSCAIPEDSADSRPPIEHPAGAEPEIITADEDTNIISEEGNFASMRCIVTGSPVPTITWKKDDTVLNGTGGKYRMLPDGTLQVIGLIQDDSGIYVCIAENSVGRSVTKQFFLQVNDGVPREAQILGGDQSVVVVSLGAPAILQCYAYGYPRPALTWWQGQRMLPQSEPELTQTRDNALILHAVTLTNLGFYTCQAYNGQGRPASWTVALKAVGPAYSTDPNDVTYNQFLLPVPRVPPPVEDRPRPPPYFPRPPPPTRHPQVPTRRPYSVPVKVDVSVDKTSYTAGETVSLPCEVEGFPPPSVSWFKDEQQIFKSNRVIITDVYRLIISNATVEDSGEYTCRGGNAFSDSEDSIYIEVKAPAVVPTNCTDNPFFANCALIVKAQYCTHKYYANFCCKSCTEAGLLNTRSKRSIPRKEFKIPLAKLALLNKIPLLPNDL